MSKATDLQIQRVTEYSKFFNFKTKKPISVLTKEECSSIISFFAKNKFIIVRGGFIYGTSVEAENTSKRWVSRLYSVRVSGGDDEEYFDETNAGIWLDKNNSPGHENDIPYINENNIKIKEYSHFI